LTSGVPQISIACRLKVHLPPSFLNYCNEARPALSSLVSKVRYATSLIGADGGCAYRRGPTYIRPQEQGKPATRELQPPVQRALYRVDFDRRSSNNGPCASSGSRPRVPCSCLLADVGRGRSAIVWEEVQASYSRRHWRRCRAWCRIGLRLGGVDTVTC
jgi:hypothetical protein